MFITYKHHGLEMWVREDLKGTHRDHCLCYSCDKFFPGRSENCPIAQALYQFDIAHNLTTPVFECVEFCQVI
jgi:hypothetical protein